MFEEELTLLLKAREPGIWINTTEEKEVILAVKNAIDKVEEYDYIYTWSMNEGIYQLKGDVTDSIVSEPVDTNPGIMALNKMLLESNSQILKKSRVWVLKDFHLVLNTPNAIRTIRDLKESPVAKYTPIIIISPSCEVPMELKSLFKVVNYDVPTIEDIIELITLWCKKKNEILSQEELGLLGKRLYGFTRSEIIKMLNYSYVKYNCINLDIINEKKIESINQSGVLDYKIPKASLNNIAGNKKFKEWVEVVEACMTEDAREYGIPAPKGYLSVGIPGQHIYQ